MKKISQSRFGPGAVFDYMGFDVMDTGRIKGDIDAEKGWRVAYRSCQSALLIRSAMQEAF